MPKYLREGMDGEGAPSSAVFNIPGTMKSSVSRRRWIGEGEGWFLCAGDLREAQLYLYRMSESTALLCYVSLNVWRDRNDYAAAASAAARRRGLNSGRTTVSLSFPLHFLFLSVSVMQAGLLWFPSFLRLALCSVQAQDKSSAASFISLRIGRYRAAAIRWS